MRLRPHLSLCAIPYPTTSVVSRVPALQALDVAKRYDEIVALAGLSLDVFSGECVALVGESGSGKTTLLRTFNRLVVPDQGAVFVGGEDIARADPVTLRRSIGYVQQEGGLLPHWNVAKNVELVPRLLKRPDAAESASAALDHVGLSPSDFGSRWPRELSGGERQRVALARAIAAHPDVILLDEPFGAVDAITRSELQRGFASLIANLGVTAILVTHDLREAFLLSDRVGVMRGGALEQLGTPSELSSAPATPYVADLLTKAGVSS